MCQTPCEVQDGSGFLQWHLYLPHFVVKTQMFVDANLFKVSELHIISMDQPDLPALTCNLWEQEGV